MASPSTCDCVRPDERPDMTCGRCGMRRLGDDLTPEQFADLVAELVGPRDGFPSGLVRVRGRKRPRSVRLR